MPDGGRSDSCRLSPGAGARFTILTSHAARLRIRPGAVITYALVALNVLISLWAFSALKKNGDMRRLRVRSLRIHARPQPDGPAAFAFLPRGHLAPVLQHDDAVHLRRRWWNGMLGLHMLTIYVASGLAATLLVFILRRNNPDYRVLGASGSITGVLFAAIVLKSGHERFLLIVPVPIPAPVFAALYIAYSTFLLDREVGNVSHEAHIGGSLTGFLLAGLLSPYHFGPLVETYPARSCLERPANAAVAPGARAWPPRAPI